MFLHSDLHFLKAYQVERAQKMLAADRSILLRDAGIRPLRDLIASLVTFLHKLSRSPVMEPTSSDPCLDCPPA